MPPQMIRGDGNQAARGALVQVIPPSGFSGFADIGFMLQHNASQLLVNVPVDSGGDTLQFRDQFCGVVLEHTLRHLAAKGAPQHDDLK